MTTIIIIIRLLLLLSYLYNNIDIKPWYYVDWYKDGVVYTILAIIMIVIMYKMIEYFIYNFK